MCSVKALLPAPHSSALDHLFCLCLSPDHLLRPRLSVLDVLNHQSWTTRSAALKCPLETAFNAAGQPGQPSRCDNLSLAKEDLALCHWQHVQGADQFNRQPPMAAVLYSCCQLFPLLSASQLRHRWVFRKKTRSCSKTGARSVPPPSAVMFEVARKHDSFFYLPPPINFISLLLLSALRLMSETAENTIPFLSAVAFEWKLAKQMMEIDFCDGWAPWSHFECKP